MSQKLDVSFDAPEHGWIGLEIGFGEQSARTVASSVPSDPFRNLADALANLLHTDGAHRVVWHEEPAEVELLFSRLEDQIIFEMRSFSDSRRSPESGTLMLKASGSYQQICLPFWRALRGLQGRFSEAEWESRWHRPFPTKEIELLTQYLNPSE